MRFSAPLPINMLLVFALASCQQTVDNTRCPAGKICYDSEELTECIGDSDCADGALCLTDGPLFGYCDAGTFLLSDSDQDTILNYHDNCFLVSNLDQANHDNDDLGDACDTDDDDDGVLDAHPDNCPLIPNDDQTNTDAANDGGDSCDTDDDNDGVPDLNDNCSRIINNSQANADFDSLGDACDSDKDGDGVTNGIDNCPVVYNIDQLNFDNDELGDACDDDADGDEVLDISDNCLLLSNSAPQDDTDNDALGDDCDPDDDNDTILDGNDNCPLDANNNQADEDNDDLGDVCDGDADGDEAVNDNCPTAYNPAQGTTDCFDDDGDGIPNVIDNCLWYANSDQRVSSDNPFTYSNRNIAPATAMPMGDACTIKKIVAGAHHTCALLYGGNLKCWGYNAYGWLGLGHTSSIGSTPGSTGKNIPLITPDSRPAIDIALGPWNTCVVLTDNTIKCWGEQDSGILGQDVSILSGVIDNYGDSITESVFRLPSFGITDNDNIGSIKNIAVGRQTSCALLAGGNIRCWGNTGSTYYTRGNNAAEPSTNYSLTNVATTSGNLKARQMHLGLFHGCAIGQNIQSTPELIDESKYIYCWGWNPNGQLGIGSTNNTNTATPTLLNSAPYVWTTPRRVVTALGWSDEDGESTYGRFSCALHGTGQLTCWGLNNIGQLGLNSISQQPSIPNTSGSIQTVNLGVTNAKILDIALGAQHVCALYTTSAVTWPTGDLTSPVWALQTCHNTTCAIKCWGENDHNQLGFSNNPNVNYGSDSSSASVASSTAITSLGSSYPLQVTAGKMHTCTLNKNNEVYCWGRNDHGEIGQGHTTNPITTPTYVDLGLRP